MDQDIDSDRGSLQGWSHDVPRLFSEMRGPLGRIAWALLRSRELAEDAVQETFILFSARADEIPSEQVRGWLIRTVQFQAKNLRRKAAREQYYESVAASLQSDCRSGRSLLSAPSDALEQIETIQQLRAAIEKLPQEQRDVVRRRMEQQQTFAEIASDIKKPISTVLSRMRLALARLTRELRNDE